VSPKKPDKSTQIPKILDPGFQQLPSRAVSGIKQLSRIIAPRYKEAHRDITHLFFRFNQRVAAIRKRSIEFIKPRFAPIRKYSSLIVKRFLALITPFLAQICNVLSSLLNHMGKRFATTIGKLRATPVSILTQITVPFMILAVFTAALGTYLISRVVVDSFEERFTNQLIETGFLAEEGVVRHEEDLLESLRLLSHIQGVDQAVMARDIKGLRDLVLPTARNAGIEALVFVDTRGIAMLSLVLDNEGQSYRTMVPAETYVRVDFLKKVLSGQVDEQGDKFSGLARTSAGSFIFVAGPVQDTEGNLVGSAMIGRSLQSLVRDLREETMGQFSIYDSLGSPLNSTLQAVHPIDSDQAQAIFERQAEGSVKRSLTDDSINYEELLVPFEVRSGEDLGLLGVALPTNFVVQNSGVTRNNTFILMSLVLFFVIVIGTLVARRITRPIQELKEAALRVSGGDLAIQVSPRGRDEVSVLTESFNDMVVNLNKSKQELLASYDRTIEGWARALDLRDHETEGHSRRVADLAVKLGSAMGLGVDNLEQLRRGALLHDIGKIAVSDEILLKKGELTRDEWSQVRRHPEHARHFMEQIEFLRPAMAIPYSHHERWDGQGYPQGLVGEQIPLLARIFAVVDVWDAITSDRPYRKAMVFASAMEVIRSESGKQLDPHVVDAFTKLETKELKQMGK
jgi:HAMP domain-containing protein